MVVCDLAPRASVRVDLDAEGDGLMGRQGALHTVHASGPLAFGVLVTVVIYVIFDLNQPSGGVITVGEESWVQLLQSMAK